MALRSDVVEAAGVRSSERRRAWADSSKRASVLETQSRLREHGGQNTLLATGPCLADPARVQRAVAVWPEEPGLNLRPPFFGDVER